MAEHRLPEAGASAALPSWFGWSADWSLLTPFFDRVGKMPNSDDAFAQRYGPFDDGAGRSGFVAALHSAAQLGARLGGPRSAARLRETLADDGSDTEPPLEFFAQLVGLARRVHTAARTLASAVESPEPRPASGQAGAERSATLRWALAGAGGLAALAADVATDIEAIRSGLAAEQGRYIAALRALHESQLVNQANVAIGRLQVDIAVLETRRAALRDPTWGWIRHTRGQDELEQLEARIVDARQDLQRKLRLVDDTADIFSTGNAVVSALARVDQRLRGLARLFTEAAERLNFVSKTASPQQLSDDAWRRDALAFGDGWPDWLQVSSAAQQCVQQAPGVAPAQAAPG